MPALVFASFNENKVAEISKVAEQFAIKILSPNLVASQSSLEKFTAVAESEDNYLGNAKLKARACMKWSGMASFADDSGLEITTLNNRPGVRTADYGAGKTQSEKNLMLISELKERNKEDRSAKFVSVQYFVRPDGIELSCRAELEGTISDAPRGNSGWGYEPIFIPQGFEKTVAELKDSGVFIKNHRALSLELLFKALLSKRLIQSD